MAHTVDENGYILIKDNPISKSGVFPYLGKNISPELEPEKIYDVWRAEEELNNPDTIESFKLSPWIPYHEMLGDDYTNAEDVGVQGVTGEDVYYRDGTLYSNLKLFGDNLKQLINGGLKELSCGFRCVWTVISGVTPDGQKYDVKQTRIRGNHLASVSDGRMGKQVAVAMDRATFALDNLNIKPDGENMELKEALAKIKELEGKIAAQEKSAEDAKAADAKKAAETKKAEDAEFEEKEKKAAEDAAKADKEKTGMDAAISELTKTVTSLSEEIKEIKSHAVDASTVVKAISDKNDLAAKASAIVGVFDHSDMDQQGVAKYALEKIGMACDSGLEVATLNGYLAARLQPTFVVDDGEASNAETHSKALGV